MELCLSSWTCVRRGTGHCGMQGHSQCQDNAMIKWHTSPYKHHVGAYHVDVVKVPDFRGFDAPAHRGRSRAPYSTDVQGNGMKF